MTHTNWFVSVVKSVGDVGVRASAPVLQVALLQLHDNFYNYRRRERVQRSPWHTFTHLASPNQSRTVCFCRACAEMIKSSGGEHGTALCILPDHYRNVWFGPNLQKARPVSAALQLCPSAQFIEQHRAQPKTRGVSGSLPVSDSGSNLFLAAREPL